MNEPRQTAIPLALRPGAYAAVAHALCRERKDLDAAAAVARETDIAIDVLARHAPPSNAQRHGVRLARRIIREIADGRRAPARPNGDGPRRPALTDIIAVTGNEPFTCAALVDRLRPYLTLSTDRIAAAHRIHVAVNRDPRFRRHEHGIYTRIHHDPDPEGQPAQEPQALTRDET